ncbi:DUF6950 family protein [Falsigemmobacter faecalis]|uniref:DUF6950 domain-containing protein n=1 Tax=Falsigemmobacter faecalis TaxID=2488730 RepID=A0A3P3DCC0_9RHOB|nr:hypothetical protein [Falsigemmobacter faecalis]RRH71989.1 hypothetical protein EG244_15865 [Falsigemmobacter faecalis]
MVQRLTRRSDWRGRLSAELDRQRRAPFAWGRQDCALGLASGAVLALTGEDLAAAWRGQYRSERGALRALRAAGHESLGAALAARLPEISPDEADLGDIALVASEGAIGEALALFDSAGLIALTEHGQGRIPRERALRAFKIG